MNLRTGTRVKHKHRWRRVTYWHCEDCGSDKVQDARRKCPRCGGRVIKESYLYCDRCGEVA